MKLTITVDFGWYFPRVTRLKVFDCQTRLFLVDLGLIRLGFWHGDIRWALIETVKNLAKDKQWLIDNAPSVRVAKRRAYAKGKAAAISDVGAEVEYWKEAAHKNWVALEKEQNENFDLRNAIRALRKLDTMSEKGQS